MCCVEVVYVYMLDNSEERVNHEAKGSSINTFKEAVQGWDEVCGCAYVREGSKWGSLNEGILLLPGYRRELFHHSCLQPPLPHEQPAPVNEHVLFLYPHFFPHTYTRTLCNSRSQTIETALFLVVANAEPCLALRLWRREDKRHGKPVLVQQISQWTKGRSCVTVF